MYGLNTNHIQTVIPFRLTICKFQLGDLAVTTLRIIMPDQVHNVIPPPSDTPIR